MRWHSYDKYRGPVPQSRSSGASEGELPQERNSSERGFTIQEMLVVLVVGSLLVSFGLSLFQFTSKIVSAWTKKIQWNSMVNGVSQRVALDVQKSGSIEATTDSVLVLRSQTGKRLAFHFGETGIWRNDVRMTDVPRGQFDMHLVVDSNAVAVEVRGMGPNNVIAVRVKPPWSSRQEFSKSLGE